MLRVRLPQELADADAPGELWRCSQCGGSSRPLPASELTVIKHHVNGQPLGHLRLYCRDHLAVAWDGNF